MQISKKQKGFTLIEVLVVIAIIAILAAIVLVAINPAKRFQDARQSQRHANVEAILSAIQQNMVDNKGIYCPSGTALPTSATNISKGSGGTEIDLTGCLGSYLAVFPYDPSATGAKWNSATDYNTKYTVKQDSTTKQVTVAAQSEVDENGDGTVTSADLVSVTR